MKKGKVMKRIGIVLFCSVALLFCGCQKERVETLMEEEAETSEVESVSEGTTESSSEETTEEASTETEEASAETEETEQEEAQNYPVEVGFDSGIRIDAREALDLVYEYLYKDFEGREYSVYLDDVYQDGSSRMGYVVGQYTYSSDSGKVYEEYTPELRPKVGRDELIYQGLSSNEFFYIFRLDTEDMFYEVRRRNIHDYIAISIDGKMIIQRGEWGEQWIAFDKLTGESMMVESSAVTCRTYMFCVMKFELSDGVLTVVANDGSANGWQVEPMSISCPLAEDCEWKEGNFYVVYESERESDDGEPEREYYFQEFREISFEEVKSATEHWMELARTEWDIQSPTGLCFIVEDGVIVKVYTTTS